MGVILRAHDALREQDVAFKRLVVKREALRAQMTALFEREFHTLAQLAHPGIVEVYDYGIDEHGPYYTMELLSGRDLRAGVPLPAEAACRLLREVASALALVHARRLVHRDLSPANVLLTEGGSAKLIDFGALTPFGRPKQIVGTAAFIAPECLKQGEIDQRADLYALGALAYWILAGKHAVRAENVNELFTAWSREIVPLAQRAPDLPRGLEELVLSLLQHDPLARPQSAAYVIDRLSAIANLPREEDSQRVCASYVAHPPLVGRDAELGRLERALIESAEGRGAAIWIEAAQGYLSHFLNAYDSNPVWTADPKRTPYRDVSKRTLTPAGLGTLGEKAAAAIADWVVVDMFANYATGREDIKGAIAVAERQAKRIYR